MIINKRSDILQHNLNMIQINYILLINIARFISTVVTLELNINVVFQIQFLNQLFSLIEQFVQEQSKMKNVHSKLDNDADSILQVASSNNSIKDINNNVNNVKDLINTMKEIDIVYQDGEITDEHIRISK